MARGRRIQAIISAVDRASPQFKKVSNSVKALGAVAAGVAAIQIGRELVGALKNAADMAGIQEQAEKKLAQSLRNTGQEVSTALPRLKEYASQLQQASTYGDEAILSNQALLVSLGNLSGRGLERATQAAIDLAAATGRDLRTSFELVGKAAAGETGTLSRYGIILDKNIPSALKFQAALEKIEKQFGGQAAAAADTYAGKIEQLQNAFGDLQESVGKVFAEIGTGFIEDLKTMVEEIDSFVKNGDSFRIAAIQVALGIVEFAMAAEQALGPIAKLFFVIGKTTWDAFALTMAQLDAAMIALGGSAEDAGSIFSNTKKKLEEMLSTARGGFSTDADDWLVRSSKEGAKKAADEMPGLIDLIVQAGKVETIEPLPIPFKIVPMGADDVPGMMKDAYAAWQRETSGDIEFDDAKDSMDELKQKIDKTFAPGAIRGFSSALINAAEGGSKAFSSFFKNLLKDLARAIAEAIILQTVLSIASGGFGGFWGGVKGLLGFGKAGGDIAATAAQGAVKSFAAPINVTFNMPVNSLDAADTARYLEDSHDAVARGYAAAIRRGSF